MRLDLAGMPGVELAVDQRMHKDFRFVAIHDDLTPAFGRDPGFAQHPARAGQTRHHRAYWRFDHDCNIAIGKVVDLAQHDHLPEFSRQLRDQPAHGGGIVPPQHRLLGRVAVFAPHRRGLRLAGIRVVGRVDQPGIRGVGRMTDIAQDGEQPGLDRAAAERVEMAERAQITFLHRVVGVAGAAQQVARQRVDIVEMRQGERLETLGLVVARVDYAARHHCVSGLTRDRYFAASTTIVPVIIGCKEQK